MRSDDRIRSGEVTALVAGVIAAIVFARTAYPTITWWDSSSYSLGAATLGVGSPPGSLVLTLIGWPIARLAAPTPAHALNLFAAILAATTVGLVCVVATRTLRIAGAGVDWLTSFGIAAGALTFAFAGTLWSYAGRFTPYVLTPVLTGVILLVMVRWWEHADEPDAWHLLPLLGLLFGLDFSVHRTNALLIPGAVLWVLIRRPSAVRSPRAVLGSVAGLVAGLAVQLLVIPLAAHTTSTLNFNEASTWSRFWDYVTLKQLGGSFLLGVFPRKSPVWSVQTLDVLRVLADNFLRRRGPAGVFGILPALAAVAGVGALWRRDRRLAIAFTGVLALQVAFTIIYFNIPANFFRTFERHYLPICVTLGVLVSCGLAGSLDAARRRWKTRAVAFTGVGAGFVLPCAQLAWNWSSHDSSRLYFARDYAFNALAQLPPHAIYFTVGDNDTFPVMYLQSVEGVRPDVTIINLSVANIPDWPEQLTRRDPSFPKSLSQAQRAVIAARELRDTTVVVPVPADAQQIGVPSGTEIPHSISLLVRPAYGSKLIPSEVLLLDIVQTNKWRRPLAFAVSATRSGMEFLAPYARAEGLYYRVVPVTNPPVDVPLLYAHVMTGPYRGYADPSVRLDDFTPRMGMQAYAGLLALLEAETAADHPNACNSDRDQLLAKLPLDRLQPPPEFRAEIETACKPPRF